MKYLNKINWNFVLRGLCCLCIAMFFVFSVWGKSLVKHVDVVRYLKNTKYNISYKSDIDYSLLDIYPELIEYLLANEDVTCLDDLLNYSSDVAIVTMNSYEFSGNGFLANCTIDKVIKGTTISNVNEIEIYDQIIDFSSFGFNVNYENTINYFDRNLPMKKGDKYIVFVQPSINPVKAGTYMYTSVSYGNFRITDTPKILKDYVSCTKTLNEVMDYDIIYEENQPENPVLINLYNEIYDKYSNYCI